MFTNRNGCVKLCWVYVIFIIIWQHFQKNLVVAVSSSLHFLYVQLAVGFQVSPSYSYPVRVAFNECLINDGHCWICSLLIMCKNSVSELREFGFCSVIKVIDWTAVQAMGLNPIMSSCLFVICEKLFQALCQAPLCLLLLLIVTHSCAACWRADRVEKQKAAAAAQEKASLKTQQDAATPSMPTPVGLAAGDLANRLEDDLKQQKAAMAQKRLSDLQDKAVTSATATPSSSLVSRIRLVQPSVSWWHMSTCCAVSACIVEHWVNRMAVAASRIMLIECSTYDGAWMTENISQIWKVQMPPGPLGVPVLCCQLSESLVCSFTKRLVGKL